MGMISLLLIFNSGFKLSYFNCLKHDVAERLAKYFEHLKRNHSISSHKWKSTPIKELKEQELQMWQTFIFFFLYLPIKVEAKIL